MKRDIDYRLYVLTDRRLTPDVAAAVEQAILGGATVVQLREKGATTREWLRAGQEVMAVCRRYGVPFIVNDRVDVALALDADGVHVGPDDMPVSLARRLLGEDKIIGFSAGTEEEARQAEAEGADYLGIGAVFATGSKGDAGEPIGVDGFLRVRRAAPSLPAVAIAGMTASRAEEVMAQGADGVAVISAVFGAPDVRRAAEALRAAVDAGIARRLGNISPQGGTVG